MQVISIFNTILEITTASERKRVTNIVCCKYPFLTTVLQQKIQEKKKSLPIGKILHHFRNNPLILNHEKKTQPIVILIPYSNTAHNLVPICIFFNPKRSGQFNKNRSGTLNYDPFVCKIALYHPEQTEGKTVFFLPVLIYANFYLGTCLHIKCKAHRSIHRLHP